MTPLETAELVASRHPSLGRRPEVLAALMEVVTLAYANGIEDAAGVADDLASLAASIQAAIELHGGEAPTKAIQRESYKTLATAIRALAAAPSPLTLEPLRVDTIPEVS